MVGQCNWVASVAIKWANKWFSSVAPSTLTNCRSASCSSATCSAPARTATASSYTTSHRRRARLHQLFPCVFVCVRATGVGLDLQKQQTLLLATHTHDVAAADACCYHI